MSDCSRYWDHADHIPLDDVIAYWCELSGHDLAHCRDAKKAAICSAIDKDLVKFRRRDGKSYEDDIYDLAARGQLLVEKDSFNEWVKQFSDAPKLEAPLGSRERDTLLVIIGLLCRDLKYDTSRAAKTATALVNTAASMGISIGETTIEGHLKKVEQALGNRMK